MSETVPSMDPVESWETRVPWAQFESELTRREAEVLAEMVLHGHIPGAASCLGLSVQTLKNHATSVYAKLGADGEIHALWLLGWLRVPRTLVRPHRVVAVLS